MKYIKHLTPPNGFTEGQQENQKKAMLMLSKNRFPTVFYICFCYKQKHDSIILYLFFTNC